jgi:2-methylcitrate dehydratase PrpD
MVARVIRQKPAAPPEDNLASDLLWGVGGARGIAKFLGLSERQTYHAISIGALPVRRVGKRIAASKKTLTGYMRSPGGRA